MATDSEPLLPIIIRKPTNHNHPKLLPDEKVEVRSLEEGFQGSWHVATVISREDLVREVQYDHLLSEDGSVLIERVNVTPILDGIDENTRGRNDENTPRGIIRPLPPTLDSEKQWSLQYGECVDMYHKSTWWEGVIFDHEVGSEDRKVFFPDMGDESLANISDLRITQSWDEVSEKWAPRGKWLFFEVIEEISKKFPLFVSIKQIWYEVRGKKGYSGQEWTNLPIEKCKNLVLQVSCDNLKLTFKQICQELASLIDLSEVNFDPIITPEVIFSNSLPIIPYPIRKARPNTREWVPAYSHMVSEPEFCPSVISKYIEDITKKRAQSELTSKVRGHLAYLGWKIECGRDEFMSDRSSRNDGLIRMRYTSPKGQIYFSLLQICRDLVIKPEDVRNNLALISQDDEKSEDSEDSEDSEKSQSISTSPNKIEKKKKIRSVWDKIKPKHCPNAVEDYLNHGLKKDKAHKAKRHLASMGWSFGMYQRRSGTGAVIKQEMRYISPTGQRFNTLKAACNWEFKFNPLLHRDSLSLPEPHTDSLSLPGPQKDSLFIPPSHNDPDYNPGSHEDPDYNPESPKDPDYNPGSLKDSDYNPGSHKVCGKRKGRKSKNGGPGSGSGPKSRPVSRVLRTRKRVSVGSTPSHKAPKTILSWLIENNVVLTGAKVKYSGGGKEGLVTSEGVKCMCCENNFTVGKFSEHSGVNDLKPFKNLILEDGRSLYDCQVELMRKKKSTIVKIKLLKKKGKGKTVNDYICSICHYGGELVLCDQCPSSFHTSCLGLTGVPDGDWFCPSCCCGICGAHRVDKATEQSTDNDGTRTCTQCEHKYHFTCLQDQGLIESDTNPSEDWFCNKNCEQIFQGLTKRLGKPVPLGRDNMSWTLLKYSKDEGHIINNQYNEDLIENYSKLSVALSVMHECFDPVRDTRTRRDIMEDVIFSRRSDLNRLNFQGFYTVLLEKNDEIVTVAVVRIHGEKVAEVPLVATRFQFRRMGMCRVLMNGLEEMLMDLGVERLVLPAVPNVLDTWTKSFGFSKMDLFTRLNFLDYTFLDFSGTILCHKLLQEVPPLALLPAEGLQEKLAENGNSTSSDVYQARLEECEIVDQEFAKAGGSKSLDPVSDDDKEEGKKRRKSNGLKYYKRRGVNDL